MPKQAGVRAGHTSRLIPVDDFSKSQQRDTVDVDGLVL